MSEIVIPAKADRLKRLADQQSGHASMNYQQTFKQDVPSDTNIMCLGLSIDDPASGAAILAAINGIAGVNAAKLTAFGTVPATAPEGEYGPGRWEFHVTAGLRGYTATSPE